MGLIGYVWLEKLHLSLYVTSRPRFSLKYRVVSQAQSSAEWSSEHFKLTGRPLRIAIDQANWWFRNATAKKEAV
ncbi:hypothetical protein F4811DRAFT_540412, partial [Daldinia bambusicola]